MAPGGMKRISTLFRSKSRKHTSEKLQPLPDEPEPPETPSTTAHMSPPLRSSPTAFLEEFDQPITDRVVVVSGASRGIGLEFVKQLSKDPRTLVVALIRNPESAQKLVAITSRQVIAVHANMTDEPSLRAAAADVARISGGKVDVLINCAAINTEGKKPLSDWDAADINAHLETNVTGPVICTNAFLPLLRKGREKRVVNLTSAMGSLTYNDPAAELSAPFAAYSISKCALNLATRKYAVEHQQEGFIFVALSAGWVRTDMGGPDAPLSVQEAVQQLIGVIDGLKKDDNGKFLHIDGTEIDF